MTIYDATQDKSVQFVNKLIAADEHVGFLLLISANKQPANQNVAMSSATAFKDAHAHDRIDPNSTLGKNS
ncbi:MAG: hypothetical protein Q7V63_06160 [Gammaproteobacteria bacterium]|nr:hypothetical protein [Gammaproteobacteria bacterium]